MTPLDAAFALSTIVGLLFNFKQGRSDDEAAKYEEFLNWLEYHRHDDLKRMVVESTTLQQEIGALLQQDSKKLLKKMESVEQMLSQVLSRISGFERIARTLHPGRELSAQACTILKQLTQAPKGFMGVADEDGEIYYFPDHIYHWPDSHYKPTESAFFFDDIRTLVDLGLIVKQEGDEARTIYRITRFGLHYAQNLGETMEPGEAKRLGPWVTNI